MTPRTLRNLIGFALLSLSAMAMACQCFGQVAQWDDRGFGGSPYVTISAINTAGGIETPRTTGKTPMFIQASASAITATEQVVGDLTTRTDDDTGTITADSGSLTTGSTVSVSWSGGSRSGMTATVTTSTISIDGGTGDVLPAADTECTLTFANEEPYDHLEYKWTLEVEDGVGGWEAIADNEGLTNPVTGQAYNQYTDQEGPEFVAVIRDEHLVGAAQTDYRLTLAIRGKNGGSYTAASVTETFTVDPWTGTTYYFDASGGNDTTGDGSEGNPWATLSGKWPTINADNVKCLLKRGTTELMTARLVNWNVTSVRFDAWGSGADPILENNSGQRLIDHFWNSPTSDTQDIVWSNIVLDGNDQTEYVMRFQGDDASAIFQFWFFDNCEIKTTSDGTTFTDTNHMIVIEGGSTDIVKGFGFYETHFDYTNGNGCCVYTGGGPSPDWVFIIGGTNTGGGNSIVLDHPFYVVLGEHFLADANTFGEIQAMNLCLNLRRPMDFTTDHGKWCIRNNDFDGNGGYVAGVSISNNQNEVTWAPAYGIAIRHNVFRDMATSSGYGVTPSVTLDGAISDNQFINNNRAIWVLNPNGRAEVYHNNIYSAGGVWSIRVQDSTAGRGRVTDNKIHDDSTTAYLTNVDITLGMTVNDNSYYAPNDVDGDTFRDDGLNQAPDLTYAEWQSSGSDPNSTYGTDFGWLDPANGDFRTVNPATKPALILK